MGQQERVGQNTHGAIDSAGQAIDMDDRANRPTLPPAADDAAAMSALDALAASLVSRDIPPAAAAHLACEERGISTDLHVVVALAERIRDR